MEGLIIYLHSLAAGVLIGKVVLLSFVVAPVLAKNLEPEAFGKVVRQLFPAYYALGMGAAVTGLTSLVLLGIIGQTQMLYHLAAGTWLAVFAAEAYCRSPLTPRSNAMRDRLKEQEARGAGDPALHAAWHRLHQRSVYLNSFVLLAGLCLLGLVHRW
jgi:hypothetical protein